MIGPEFVVAIFLIGLCGGYAVGYLVGRIDRLQVKQAAHGIKEKNT